MSRSLARRRRLLRLASLGALSAAMFPSEARAEGFTAAASAYVSFVFGERFGVGWGVEGSASYLIAGSADDCLGQGRGGMGLALQVGAINVDTFKFVGAVHGGANVDGYDSVVIDGEAGVAVHAGESNGVGIHTGVLVDVPFSPISTWTNFVRAEWLLDEYSIGGGVTMPGRFGFSQQTCVIGRPLRGDDAIVHPGAPCVASREGTHDAPFALDAPIVRAWMEDAQAEIASVPAFLTLARELLEVGAPMRLVDAALDAVEDELRHARACAAIASRLCGRRVAPVIPAAPARANLGAKASLVRLGVESFLDGCLNEGAASARARSAARAATEGDLGATLTTIASDEARHATLGWDVLRFALDAGGDDVRDAVAERRGAEIEPLRGLGARDEAWGQLTDSSAREVNEAVARSAHTRLETWLAGA